MVVSDIVLGAFRLLGIRDTGDTVRQAEALAAFNALVQFWEIDDLIEPHTEYSALTDTLLFSDEYEKPLKYFLAIDLAPEYNIVPADAVLQQYNILKSQIEAFNRTPGTESSIDQGLLDV